MSDNHPHLRPNLPNARLTWNLALAAGLCSLAQILLGFTGTGALASIGGLLGLVGLVCMFAFYIRTAMVARILNPGTMFSEPLWIVVAFFTPFANVILPWLLVRRYWRTTASASGYPPDHGMFAMHLWWIVFVFSAGLALHFVVMVLGPAAEQAALSAQPAPLPPKPLHVDLSIMVQWLLFILMANRLTRMQADVVGNNMADRFN